MKYRVIKEYGLFYPQRQRLFFWTSTTEPTSSYHTLEEALEDIESHKRIFSKIRKVDIVWRSW